MQSGRSHAVANANPAVAAGLQPLPETLTGSASLPVPAAEAAETRVRPSGYGLPCAHCRTYYAADLRACPVCKSPERVSPVAAAIPTPFQAAEPAPDPDEVAQERERFLREFKAQVYASHMQISTGAGTRCALDENHADGHEPAAICRVCYDRQQERVDSLEAALHLDLKEATEIVYQAVWADSSDPSKTYQNAAQALLAELRRRGGITLVFGPLQPLQH
jgi:hypothetical protein